jgi:hypothetical protein
MSFLELTMVRLADVVHSSASRDHFLVRFFPPCVNLNHATGTALEIREQGLGSGMSGRCTVSPSMAAQDVWRTAEPWDRLTIIGQRAEILSVPFLTSPIRRSWRER